ncbi:MAG: squalene/phytoene synthase family protein [Betaproteobacteria bacterium]
MKHYENFPVASWLCPPPLRAPIMAIYHFARTADDMADEGDASPSQRLQALKDFREMLKMCVHEPQRLSGPYEKLFLNLSNVVETFNLPKQPFFHLLDAFEQDVLYTEQEKRYESQEALLLYCSKSANPIGRLLLHLYGIQEADSIRRSDAICTSLQLINFWQDLSVDIPRGRFYLPLDCELEEELSFAHALMIQGSPLCERVPGRAAWELKMVVQGGLKILQKCRKVNTYVHRPRIAALDFPSMLLRALS